MPVAKPASDALRGQVTNYLTAIISAAQFANVENESPPDLDQLGNMRRQSEKMSREQALYRKRSDNWIDWEGPARAQDMPPTFPHLSSRRSPSQMFSALAAM